jgi:integrase/recombinase XerD
MECRGDFAPLVRFMFLTGCRPGEARALLADQVNWQSGRAVLQEHKTRGKTGKPKSIYLSDGALAILVEQRGKYGTGLLFRGKNGQMFSSNSVHDRWQRIRDRLGLRAQAIPYSLRHSFATHLLEGGASSRDVAELLGHTSTVMVETVYGHHVSIDRLRGVAGRLDQIG